MAHGDAREGKWRGKMRMEWVASRLASTLHTPRLPVVDRTDPPADWNGLDRFTERPILVSALVPSCFALALPLYSTQRTSSQVYNFSPVYHKHILLGNLSLIFRYDSFLIDKEVKWPRYRPGVAQSVGRGIALLFHDRGTRRGWVVSSTPQPHFTPGKEPVPILQEAGWTPGPVWTGGKSRPHWDSIPDCPARSQLLYQLSYPAQAVNHLGWLLSAETLQNHTPIQ